MFPGYPLTVTVTGIAMQGPKYNFNNDLQIIPNGRI